MSLPELSDTQYAQLAQQTGCTISDLREIKQHYDEMHDAAYPEEVLGAMFQLLSKMVEMTWLEAARVCVTCAGTTTVYKELFGRTTPVPCPTCCPHDDD